MHSFYFLQKVSGQQIFETCLKIFFSLKVFHHPFFFSICCSHPCLIKIRFQGSTGMDPKLLAIILLHNHFLCSLFFHSLIFFLSIYFFLSVSQSYFFHKLGYSLNRSCNDLLTNFPHTWTFVCRDTKSQVRGVGVPFRVCSITSEYPVYSWNSSHVPGRHMSFVLLNLNLKGLSTKNTRRSILYQKHALIIFL